MSFSVLNIDEIKHYVHKMPMVIMSYTGGRMTMSGGGEVVLKCLCPLLTMVIMSYTGGRMIMSGVRY